MSQLPKPETKTIRPGIVRLPSKSLISLWEWVQLAAVFIAMMAVGAPMVLLATGQITVLGILGVNIEQRAVRKYLKDNTIDGKWEEVRWYPLERVKLKGRLRSTKEIVPIWKSGVRLEYRAVGPDGSQALFDKVFILSNDRKRVTEVANQSAYWEGP